MANYLCYCLNYVFAGNVCHICLIYNIMNFSDTGWSNSYSYWQTWFYERSRNYYWW